VTTVTAAPADQIDLIDLSAERVNLATPDSLRQAAKDALDAGHTHYTDRPGVAALREAVALKLAEVNRIHMAPADEVLITCGLQEALYLAMQVLVGPGDEVILTDPALPEDIELVRMVGATARIAPATDELALDVDQVQALLSPATALILLRSPSRVGRVPDEDTLEALAALVIEHDLRVLAVEAEEDLVRPGVRHHSIAGIAGLAPRTVTVNDFGGLGLDAWRVGYLAAQRELMSPIRRLKQELSICSPAVSQYAALAAMSQLSGYLAAAGDRLDMRRVALSHALQAHGVARIESESGMYVMAWPGAGMHARDVVEQAKARGLRIATGESVGAPGWLRLTLDAGSDELGEAAARLASAMEPADTV
jgi:aspartate/methionine/tyrosine aminotransferase